MRSPGSHLEPRGPGTHAGAVLLHQHQVTWYTVPEVRFGVRPELFKIPNNAQVIQPIPGLIPGFFPGLELDNMFWNLSSSWHKLSHPWQSLPRS